MAQKEPDRRVRRTRALLRQSLTELLKEKSVRDITVKELTERADVNRGTFYCHYQDIDDMVKQLEDELFEEFDEVMRAYPVKALRGGIQPILRDVFTFIARNADLCASLIGSQKDSVFLERMKATVYQRVAAEWGALYVFPTETMRKYALSFFVGGVVSLIQAWADGGWQETPEELAELGDHLMIQGLGSPVRPE